MDNAEVFKYLITQGPFAVLFVWLLMKQQKQNEEREERYQSLLEKMSDKYDIIVDELKDIKNKLTGRH